MLHFFRNSTLVRMVLFCSTICALCSVARAQETPPYRDPKLPVEQRVADLLVRMTLEEKLAQMEGAWENPQFLRPQEALRRWQRAFLPERPAVVLKNGLGEISRPSEDRGPRAMAEFTNSVQKWVKENTRLGIPIVFHDECLHGHVAPGGTVSAGHRAFFDVEPRADREVFTATAAEVRARGAQHCLAPVLDLARDPRWGRTEETYGEDPYLVSRIGVAAIKGFQGVGPFIDNSHVMATAKHFAVHGQPEGGTNVAPATIPERVVREYFLKPFVAAVEGSDTYKPSWRRTTRSTEFPRTATSICWKISSAANGDFRG